MREAITGARELDRVLAMLPRRIARKVVTGALRAAARPVLREARARLPVDTGASRKDLKIRTVPYRVSPTPRVIVAGSRSKGGRDYILYFLEYGTAAHAMTGKRKRVMASAEAVYGKKVRHPGVRPRPFLRPAFDATWREALAILGRELGERIEKEAAKLA